jgi:hypothetical protein
MARVIEFEEDDLVIRYMGVSALTLLHGEVRVPFRSIRSVTVGLDDLPKPWVACVGVSYAPFRDTRRGIFFTRKGRIFLDLTNRRRAVVMDLQGQGYTRVAIEPESNPEGFAADILARSPSAFAP